VGVKRFINLDLVSGGILLFLGLFIWVQSKQFPSLAEGHPGPALFPGILGGGLAISGVLLIVLNIRTLTSNSELTAGWPAFIRLVSGLVIVCSFPILADPVGFIPTIGLVCFCLGLLLRVRWWKSVLAASGAATLIYLIFSVLLGLPL